MTAVYSQPLTNALFTHRFYLSAIPIHERDAAAYTANPGSFPYLKDSGKFADLARFKAARKLVEFCKLVAAAGSPVFVGKGDGLVYMQGEST